MRNKNFTFTMLIISLLLLISCASDKSHDEQTAIVDQDTVEINEDDFEITNHSWSYITDEATLSITLDQDQESEHLKGRHCFVSQNGSRIDCCDDQSFKLKKNGDFTWKGKIRDCYNDSKHKVQIEIQDSFLTLIYLKSDHDFLKDTIICTPSTD